MTELNDTLSIVELLWIAVCFIGLVIIAKWTLGRWQDKNFAKRHDQHLRELAGWLLVSVGIGVSLLLAFNGAAGIISGTVKPSGGVVSPQAFAIAILLILGQLSVLVMVYAIGWIFDRLVSLGRGRVTHEREDQGK